MSKALSLFQRVLCLCVGKLQASALQYWGSLHVNPRAVKMNQGSGMAGMDDHEGKGWPGTPAHVFFEEDGNEKMIEWVIRLLMLFAFGVILGDIGRFVLRPWTRKE